MPAMPFIHIHSSKFPIMSGEAEELVNEGTYGKALAMYVEENLKKRGYDIPFICCEDWGWWVEVKGQPFALGCCVYGASDAGDKPELCLSISREAERKWNILRFRFVDTRSRVEKLFEDLKEIFSSDPDVQILGFPSDYPFE